MSDPDARSLAAELLQRPDELLDVIAADVWQAYNAMQSTKSRHFELLEALDLKKKNYNLDADPAEQALLACLLTDHDHQVARFTEASRELKSRDGAAHLALFNYIGQLNRSIDIEPVRH